ncbi:hypothetical protein GGR00_001130 [Aminobacter aganoensis]|uniref:Uncharacterized protein n=1 Tax=Aminobacter aganoensis TaxID=83264 RepID=A0A7X0F588_9HYPH|nr:hypothetical protein [Aminobacter aganoensis]
MDDHALNTAFGGKIEVAGMAASNNNNATV